MRADQNTYIVELGYQPSATCDREQLEDVAAHVADTLDENTPDAVLGAVVSFKQNPPAIEVSIEIAADSPSELHRHLAEVSELLEEATADLSARGYTESTRSESLAAA